MRILLILFNCLSVVSCLYMSNRLDTLCRTICNRAKISCLSGPSHQEDCYREFKRCYNMCDQVKKCLSKCVLSVKNCSFSCQNINSARTCHTNCAQRDSCSDACIGLVTHIATAKYKRSCQQCREKCYSKSKMCEASCHGQSPIVKCRVDCLLSQVACTQSCHTTQMFNETQMKPKFNELNSSYGIRVKRKVENDVLKNGSRVIVYRYANGSIYNITIYTVRAKTQTKKVFIWWPIVVAVGVVILILVLVVIIVVIRRRAARRLKEKTDKPKPTPLAGGVYPLASAPSHEPKPKVDKAKQPTQATKYTTEPTTTTTTG